MLTPEYLEELEKNKILDLYNQLNIDITSDIIKRLSNTGNISSYNKKQLRALIEANGNDIFKEALLKTQLLDNDVKTELTKVYEDMAKTDLKGYKTLFNYRDIEFKLTGSQLKILNKGIMNNVKSLDNLTNTVAFSSKQMYTVAVNKAYMQVISSGKDYESATLEAYQDLASKGVTLKDSLGRNVGLDTAIRRNIRAGIQQTANIINRDIDDELGCDGVETTAHEGARPTHQVWQGRQFALKQSDARKYGVDLWDKYKDELNDYNCRHTYFGIILGISEPVYSTRELYDMNNRKVLVNGKYMDYYEATQKMHYYESNIRNYKRQSETYKKALENDNNNAILKRLLEKSNSKIREWQAKYTDFSRQVGIAKDYNKTRVILNNTLNNQQKSSIISAIEKADANLKKHYDWAISKGMISTLIDFNTYKQIDNELNKLSGIKSYNGVIINGHSMHSVDRVIGHIFDTDKDRARSGVEIDDIAKTLRKWDKVIEHKNDYKLFGNNINVSFDINTGKIIQVNPNKE